MFYSRLFALIAMFLMTQVGPTIGPLAARGLSSRRFRVTSNSRISQLKEQVNHIKEIIDLLLFYILNAAQW